MSKLVIRGNPLDKYRKLASFDWKRMRVLIESEDIVKFKDKIWKQLEGDALFHKGYDVVSFDEYRKLTALRSKKFKTWNILPIDELVQNPAKVAALNEATFMYDGSFSVKYFLSYGFLQTTLMGLGTQKHMSLYDDLNDPNCEQIGSFSLTEFSHGSNTKAVRTTATFDPESQQFILNTPDFEAAKCWVGNLGKTSTITVVFAKLILPSGEDCGLHTFLVPIRNAKTMLTFPGIKIGDLGPKVGLNGIDNGFIAFDNYPVPKDSLLNKNGDVTADGKYITAIKDPSKRLGASLGALSAGRIGIITISHTYLAKALTTSIRYSAARKQFGPTDAGEVAVIEYPLQQWRLFRYLSCVYALKLFIREFGAFYYKANIEAFMGDPTLMRDSGAEIHALSCAVKSLSGWLARDGIQESREACGGHGFLKATGIGELRDDNDGNVTYEGDNNVILQQTANWLIGLWAKKSNPSVWETPLNTVDFLKNWKSMPTTKSLNTVEDLITAYEWLVCYLLDKTATIHNNLKSRGLSDFEVKNHSQVYSGRELSLAYAECNVLKTSWKIVRSMTGDNNEQQVLQRVLYLFGGFLLENHLALLYEGGFLKGPTAADQLKTSIKDICGNLKGEAISLVDVIAPTDFCMNTPLGSSDGQIYSRIETVLTQARDTFSRPTWWKEFVAKL